MQNEFESNILKNKLFNKQNSLLLAISGGVDSVVLAYLLKKGNYNFALAHCNFKLRAKDSEADEAFCKTLAKNLDLKFYSQSFDVESYCKKNKVSIQMAARELRYNWFNELLVKNKLDYIVTAHHANDVVETILINLCRGTGINGLKGIPTKNGNLVRPLLNFTKEQLLEFATKENISYRTDKSNFEAKYERNFLRLNILPELKKIHPNLEQTFLNNVANFNEEAQIVNDFLKGRSKKIVSESGDLVLLDKELLKKEKQQKTLLHFILEPYKFNKTQINDIISNLTSNGQIGKLFFNSDFVLNIDRRFIVIKPKTKNKFKPLKIKTFDELQKSDLIKISDLKTFKPVKKNELVIEKERLVFPLTIRGKKTGDKFKPFGMNGFKLLSDFFKDQKLNAFEKENCHILENGNGDIIWVMGYRSDDRYKITSNKTELIKITAID